MLSAVSLFCDDVRDEKSGATSIIGVYSDNMGVESVPFVFPKLAIYTRVLFGVAEEAPEEISIKIVQTNGQEMPLTTFDRELIHKSARESKEKGATNAGLIATAILVGFRVQQEGRMNVIAKAARGADIVCGTLNIQVKSSASA